MRTIAMVDNQASKGEATLSRARVGLGGRSILESPARDVVCAYGALLAGVASVARTATAAIATSISLLSAIGCDDVRLCEQGRCDTSEVDSSSDGPSRSTRGESYTSSDSERSKSLSEARPTPSQSFETSTDGATSDDATSDDATGDHATSDDEALFCSELDDAGDDRGCVTCDLVNNRGCNAERPFCVVGHQSNNNADATGVETECVQCIYSADCGRGAPVCLENRCVECGRDDDCTTSKASRCDRETNQCVPCNGDGQCAHLSQTPVCNVDHGRCVECTREDNALCGARVCNVLEGEKGYNTCAEHEAGATPACGECVNDAQCETGLRCVPEINPFFSDELTGKFHCLPLERELSGNRICENNRPFNRPFLTKSEGGVLGTYCRVTYATCTAFMMFGKKPYIVPEGEIQQGDAICLSNESCGLPGVGDGVCTTSGCTYFCETEMACPGEQACLGVCLPW